MMTEGLNPWLLVRDASLIVQIVMALLLVASIVSWSIMLRKRAELRRARADADRFEEVFWSGGDLTAMFRAIDQGRRVTKGMEAIFEQGFREFSRMRQQGGFASAQLIEGSRRGMRGRKRTRQVSDRATSSSAARRRGPGAAGRAV